MDDIDMTEAADEFDFGCDFTLSMLPRRTAEESAKVREAKAMVDRAAADAYAAALMNSGGDARVAKDAARQAARRAADSREARPA